ncbi:hypothetical protein PC111_g2698 [Phytophthora cactorum]|nr:hypothetical protein PC111_g2698 [Phytophthora cactorum]KAG3191244.1 hypothetical protein PC128_g11020 [Phytophthora cactorum]
MLTPNEYAYGDCCKLIPSSYHLGHSGITRSMIRLRRKKKRLSAEAFLHADPQLLLSTRWSIKSGTTSCK